MNIQMPATPTYDVSKYSDEDLYGIVVGNNQNFALRGAALKEKDRRSQVREDTRDAKHLAIAQTTAKAAKMAAWAAIFSAAGAIAQAVIATLK
jgi:crotonobetainyl-CoA:carnitine CoA-transferase CaiB-like acyl-CoA transferase